MCNISYLIGSINFVIFVFMRSTICLLMICLGALNSFAQEKDSSNKKAALFIGLGNYEYLHIGISYSFKQTHYAELAVGIKPWSFNSSNYQMAYFCLGTKFSETKTFVLTPSIHLKCIIWRFDNDYNRFVVFGINPEFRITRKIKKEFAISLNAGALYNSPLTYKRKTYMEVGWPKEWQPTFSLQLLYFIK